VEKLLSQLVEIKSRFTVMFSCSHWLTKLVYMNELTMIHTTKLILLILISTFNNILKSKVGGVHIKWSLNSCIYKHC